MVKSKENVLKTERMILRPLQMEDIDDFYEIFSSDGVARFLHRMSREDVERYFAKKFSKPLNPNSYAAVLKENGKMVGTCGVKVDQETNVGELSYVFNPKYWNRGLCTEACRAILENCFNSGVEKIEADCFEDNLASIRILKDKLHMRPEAKEKSSFNEATNKLTKYKFFGLTKEEYFKQKEGK